MVRVQPAAAFPPFATVDSEDQSNIPTRPIPVPEPPPLGMTPSIAAAMLGVQLSRGSGGAWEPPPPEELQRDFPLYEIRGILGRGGMGAVYKGWQKSLDRLVAIKILPPDLEDGISGFTERFKREAKAMAQLEHPGIVAVYDAGTTPSGLLYFVMQCITGTDVQRLVTERGRLEPAEALRITSAVCDALGYAHAHGLIHRDIKPSNIMLDEHGAVKVADFGLAKSTAPETTMLTGSHVTMGTPDFMAPEAMQGTANVDHRADIYAVGVMLYQMLTGKVPRGRFVAPSRAVPGLDKRLDAIVDKALQPEREARYSSALELRTAIQPILTRAIAKRDAGSGGASASRKKALILALAALAVVAIAVGTVFAIKKAGKWPAANAAQSSLALQRVEPSATNGHLDVLKPPTTLPAASTGVWQPLFTEAEWQASDAKGREFKDGVLHVQGGRAFKTQPSADGAIRARLLLREDAKDASVFVRKDAATSGYKLMLRPQLGTVHLSRDYAGQSYGLGGVQKLPTPRQANQSVLLELRAQGNHLTALVDGTVMIEADDDQLQAPGQWGVASQDGWFESVEVQTLAATAPSPAAEKWVTVLDKSSDYPAGHATMLQNGWVTGKGDTTNRLGVAAGQEMRDGAIRAEWLWKQGISPSGLLTLRAGNGAKYQLFRKSGSIWLEYIYIDRNVRKAELLQQYSLPTAGEGETFTTELRAVGSTVTAKFNGKEIIRVEDRRLTSGIPHVLPPLTGGLRNIEVLNLDQPAGVAVSQSPPLPVSSSSPSLATATKDAPFVNSLGMKFVPVPITGGPTGGQRVLFSVWETRIYDYRAFAEETRREWPKSGISQTDSKHPAVMVSWDDAQAFCTWLTEKERKAGKLGKQESYRLPSDHEWSCAVGIGEREDLAKTPEEKSKLITAVFPWGTTWPPPAGAGNYSGEESANVPERKIQSGYRDDFPFTAPVGSYAANRLGLFDLGGNAREWCGDFWKPGDPSRVRRGATFSNNGREVLDSSFRDHSEPSIQSVNCGFRVVLAPASSIGPQK